MNNPGPLETRFLQDFRTFLGRYFLVVTGRNAYTFDKEKHAKLMENDGVYLLLENPPEKGMRQTYDKALFLPARIADRHFATNDPAKIKSSFHIAADKMRLKFHAQLHRIYDFANPSFIVKTIEMDTSRKSFKLRKEELAHLWKYHGSYIFLCLTPDGRLLDIVIKHADQILIKNGQGSREIPIDLSAEGIERMKIMQTTAINKFIDHSSQVQPSPAKESQTSLPVNGINQGSSMDPRKVVDMYLSRGMEIILTIPEGKESLILRCMITNTERVPR